MGARGTGCTTQESRNSATFYIFLDEGFSVREQVEIKISRLTWLKSELDKSVIRPSGPPRSFMTSSWSKGGRTVGREGIRG